MVIWLRNRLFDWKVLPSARFNFPLICVGNLALGGTGKTPMTEYIVSFLRHRYVTATLSRGYKRKTRGFTIATEGTTALEIGDEPMQFHRKFPEITVAVGEERLVAIPQLLQQRPETRVIILDDAFQHRAVEAGMNILLTDYSNLYTRDWMFPVGQLRDVPSSSRRARIIIITKCPSDLTVTDKETIIREINPLKEQQVFFTSLTYDIPYPMFDAGNNNLSPDPEVLLICGIANPDSLIQYMHKTVKKVDIARFPDHHIFTSTDLQQIKDRFEKLDTQNRIILTTEKDAMRLEKFRSELNDYPIYVLPVGHHFLFGEENIFQTILLEYVASYPREQSEE